MAKHHENAPDTPAVTSGTETHTIGNQAQTDVPGGGTLHLAGSHVRLRAGGEGQEAGATAGNTVAAAAAAPAQNASHLSTATFERDAPSDASKKPEHASNAHEHAAHHDAHASHAAPQHHAPEQPKAPVKDEPKSPQVESHDDRRARLNQEARAYARELVASKGGPGRGDLGTWR